MFNLFFWKKPKASLAILYFMAFFLSLAGALPAYVQSSYIESFVGLSAVAWFFIIANFLSVISIIFFPKIIKRFGNYKLTGVISILLLISIVGLGLSKNSISIFLFFVVMQIASNLIWINMDIFVENFSSDSSTGRTRTIYFTIINLAWIISPVLSAWLINLNGYSTVFLTTSGLFIPFLIIFLIKAKKIKDRGAYKHASLKKTLKKMFKNYDLRGIFGLAMLLNVFYNATTIFVPIYLNKVISFSWTDIGLMFTIMLIPFILFEIPAGIIADKYLGEKELFYLGFSILIICLFIIFINSSNNFWFWASLLFVSRIGASLVEAMRETYFFKKVGAEDIDKINIFRTTTPLGYLLGSAFSLVILIFLPIPYIFLATAIILCLAFPLLTLLKDTK